jgi:hypothetical protein
MAEEKKEELTAEKAKALLLKEQQEKQLKCQAEIQAVLDKYGMQIQGYAIIPANQVSIVPK